MGQCFGIRGGQTGSRGNKRFEYRPQKSWKYKDAHVMNQFKALSMESEGEGDDDYDGHLVVRMRAVSSDSEEEIFTTEPRGSGANTSHLVFTEEEEEEEEEEEIGETHLPQKASLVNKGFQFLEDEGNNSPIISTQHQSTKDEDRIKLIDDNDDIT